MYDVVPSNLVMKRVSPRWWLAGLTTVWGVIAMSLGFVRNYVSQPLLLLLLQPISSPISHPPRILVSGGTHCNAIVLFKLILSGYCYCGAADRLDGSQSFPWGSRRRPLAGDRAVLVDVL
jgi:hypothetical protein